MGLHFYERAKAGRFETKKSGRQTIGEAYAAYTTAGTGERPGAVAPADGARGASGHEQRRDRALPAVRVRGRPASGRPPVCPRGGREPRAAFGRGARGGAK